MSDLKTATSAIPSVLVANYLPSSEAALYTCTTGNTVRLASAVITNTDSSARTVTLSIVKSGDSAGGANRILPTVSLGAGQVLDLGAIGWLAAGDFVSGVASVASKVSVVITGVTFSAAPGGTLTGIQDDAIGTGGRTVATGTVTGTNTVGTASNRYLIGALWVAGQGILPAYGSYTTPVAMTCTSGTMTRLVSADFSYGSIVGSVHLFGYANPGSGSTQTLTGTAGTTGVAMDLALGSFSLSGVASTTGTATNAPTTATALNLAGTSAVGHRGVFAAAFDLQPQDVGLHARIKYFNYGSTSGTVPHYFLLGDALGVASLPAITTSNNTFHSGVFVDLVPA